MTKSPKSRHMSLFKSLFGSAEGQQPGRIDWKMLTDVAQLDDIINESAEKPAIIFKHSTRCGISRMTLKRFENDYALEDKVTPYFLDLLAYRDVSNAISRLFHVEHQSPQLLVIKDGKSIYDVSHDGIEANGLADRL